MHVERLNRPLLSLAENHIARKFLIAFMDCRRNCVGREIPYSDDDNPPVDQEWYSQVDGKTHRFSSFAYENLSFDIVLDGWLTKSPHRTSSEETDLKRIPNLRVLMKECQAACEESGNETTHALVLQVINMLDLWENCIAFRPLLDDKISTNSANGEDDGGIKGVRPIY